MFVFTQASATSEERDVSTADNPLVVGKWGHPKDEMLVHSRMKFSLMFCGVFIKHLRVWNLPLSGQIFSEWGVFVDLVFRRLTCQNQRFSHRRGAFSETLHELIESRFFFVFFSLSKKQNDFVWDAEEITQCLLRKNQRPHFAAGDSVRTDDSSGRKSTFDCAYDLIKIMQCLA